MTERVSRRAAARTSFFLLAVFVLSSCATNSKVLAIAQPEPLPPGFIYSDNFVDDVENSALMNRLRILAEKKHRVDAHIEQEIADEREITDEQIGIQAMLEAKARERANAAHPPDYPFEDSEPLPIPAAMIHHEQHPSKRHGVNAVSYMSLCHFKICNMGRKRQSK
ncbi:uncharacterized protein LOC114931643 [Nylanderia fulva]|uniref:uncharacterized protein LOC114931643 n=1 Tax=Nylanderia fulva TaxID=613905 RepID=UPI0010FB61B3|nr:uncharacterized protein LOC114931643 [Nylanderia fulva]XP_029159604.1 uncharacterized protein LOC114931643 [Nylanderia fulva]